MAKAIALLVLANPYLFLHDDGEPGCVVHSVAAHDPDNRRLGARLRVTPTFKAAPHSGQHDRQETRHDYDHDPFPLPDLAEYRKAIRSGELFAADEKTAKEVGIEWVPLDKQIAAAKAAAIDRWKAANPGEEVPAVLAEHEFGSEAAKRKDAARAQATAEAKAKAAADAKPASPPTPKSTMTPPAPVPAAAPQGGK